MRISLFARVGSSTVLLVALILFCAAPVAAQTITPWLPPATVVVTIAPPGTATSVPLPPGNYAGVVVRYGDGNVLTRCVYFDAPLISGGELLVRAGLFPAINNEGAVCALSEQGCPVDDCFCRCPFPDCEYWAYYHLKNGAWEYSNVSALEWVIRDGDVDGWSWGEGDFESGLEPPVIAFDEICPAVELTVTPTPTIGYTPLPHYTLTPTATPTPAPTPPPAEIPEPATLLLLAPALATLGAWSVRLRRR